MITLFLYGGILLVSFPESIICDCNQNASCDDAPALHRTRNLLPVIPDEYLSVPQLIKKNGYPVETHKLDSGDGYLLQLHRIPYGKSCPLAPNKSVVFLQHGLFGSSADWIVSGPEHALAYFLADAGFDVWLGNSRGNAYSDYHINLNTSDDTYWNFSWEQMGDLDLAAVIDYTLNITGQNCLFYVGHSMGSAMFFILMSSQPEYNIKIRASFQLAPDFYFIYNNNFQVMTDIHAVGEFVIKEQVLDHFDLKECLQEEIPASVCHNLRFLIGGYSHYQVNKSTLPSILSHQFAGTSAKAFSHYAQAVSCGELHQYDYGPVANMEIYGCPEPPGYNLSIVTSPVYIYHSTIDPVVGACEIEDLSTVLPNTVSISEVSLYTHWDFLWGINARTEVYEYIVKEMKSLNATCHAGSASCGMMKR